MGLRLVALDMDGTLVDIVSSWGSVHRHFGDSNDAALAAFNESRIGDQEFVRSDIRKWRGHEPGLSVFDLDRILAPSPLMPGARELIQGLRAAGVRTAIVSAGIDVLAKRVGRELGIDYVLANGFRTDAAGRLTGEGIIRVPIREKEAVLRGIQSQFGVSPEETGAIGNSEIDIGMFRCSRVGIAFRPADDAIRRAATRVLESGSLELALDALLGPDGRKPP